MCKRGTNLVAVQQAALPYIYFLHWYSSFSGVTWCKMALNIYVKKPFPEARTYVENILSYTFTNENLLREALHAGGPIRIDGHLAHEANKTLAVVGDAAIHLVIAHDGYLAGQSRGMSSSLLVCHLLIHQ